MEEFGHTVGSKMVNLQWSQGSEIHESILNFPY